MGNSSDASAVLDARARVRGVSNLRVVDASSFPLLPPGHPVATVCEWFAPFSTSFSSFRFICSNRVLGFLSLGLFECGGGN